MTDKQLDELLKAAAPAPDLPSSCVRDVWRDIEHRQLADSGRWLRLSSFFEWFARPAPRLAICALALGLGIFSGIRSSGVKPADPVVIYAHSINPLAPAVSP